MVDMMPFAQALYEVGSESKKDALFQEQLKELNDVWQDNEEWVQVLKHPKIKREDKEALMKEIIGSDIDEILWRFLRVLIKNDVAAYLPKIYQDYEKCFNDAHHIEYVDVESASKLSDKQVKDLKRVLSKKLHKTVEINVIINPVLIAGLRVRTQNLILDNTVLSKAEMMKERIQKS